MTSTREGRNGEFSSLAVGKIERVVGVVFVGGPWRDMGGDAAASDWISMFLAY